MPKQVLHPLTKVLDERTINRSKFARRLGYTPEHLYRVERGERAPSPDFRQAVAEALDLPESGLFRVEMT